MFVSCSYCGGLHKRGQVCEKRPKRIKVNNDIVSFRNSNVWKKKSMEIRKRDRFLCQVCLLDNRYIFNGLEVHHIIPIIEKWEKRLDNYNLITLCTACHKLADNGKIDAIFLGQLAAKIEKASQAF